MARQTALEWYAKEHHNLLIQLEGKRLSIGEYAVRHHDILQQAKQMEKEQILISYLGGDSEFGYTALRRAEQYYNETYRKE